MAEGLRPTPNRVRETLFNWLQFDIVGARCLDLFAGSGILGIEAASRGAKSVSLIEQDVEACTKISEAIESLNAERVELRQGDAFEILAAPPEEHSDIVFADPPFRQGMISTTIDRLDRNDWVVSGSKIYLEMESESSLAVLPQAWRVLKSGVAGDVAYYLVEKH